jgi:hypothetical protein
MRLGKHQAVDQGIEHHLDQTNPVGTGNVGLNFNRTVLAESPFVHSHGVCSSSVFQPEFGIGGKPLDLSCRDSEGDPETFGRVKGIGGKPGGLRRINPATGGRSPKTARGKAVALPLTGRLTAEFMNSEYR